MAGIEENREWTKIGKFYLSGLTKSGWHGELHYHATDGINLNISEEPDNQPFLGEATEYETIYGVIEGSELVTLIHCFDLNVSNKGFAFVERKILVNNFLTGIHLKNSTKPTFRRFFYRSPAFSQWYAKSGLSGKRFDPEKENQALVHYTQPKKFQRKLDDLRSVTVSSTLSYSLSVDTETPIKLRERPGITIRYRKKVSLDKVLNDVRALEMFFSLGAGVFTGPPEIYLWTRPVAKKRKNPEIPCRFFSSESWYREREPIMAPNRPLRFQDIRDQLVDVLTQWFDNWAKLANPSSLYLISKESGANLEGNILFRAQALEALHRSFYKTKTIPDSEFKAVKKSLKEAIPDDISGDVVSFFKERLPQRNELGLSERLKELFEAFDEETEEGAVNIFPNYKKDAGIITKYRNDLSHALNKHKSESDIKLKIYISYLMDTFTLLTLLRLGGVPKETLINNFKNSWTLNRVVQDRPADIK